MNRFIRWISLFSVGLIAGALPFLAGCASLGKVGELGAAVGQGLGVIDSEQAEAIARTSKAVAKTFEDITPDQEYWIGRAVAASVLQTYAPLENNTLNHYLNTLGQGLALASNKPETFGGYRFMALDSDDINAFACPGGLILVTRGMLRLCQNEDELAAVLAHEIGHVELNHGLRAISSSRITSALTIIATEGAKQFGGEQLAELTKLFEGSITDITSTMMSKGYGRGLEREADEAAVRILTRVGYDPHGLPCVLEALAAGYKPDGLDFAKTHPNPLDRVKAANKNIGDAVGSEANAERVRRFKQAMAGI